MIFYLSMFSFFVTFLYAMQYLKDIDDLRSQLSAVQATADANVISAESAKLQYLDLLKELDEKSNLLKDYEDRVNRLGEQVKDLQAREASQNQVKNEVLRMEQEIVHAVVEAGATKDCELRKLLDEVSPKNIEMLSKLLTARDKEIAKLREDMRDESRRYERKIKELESEVCHCSVFCYKFPTFHNAKIQSLLKCLSCFSCAFTCLWKQYLEKHQKLKKRVKKLEYDLQFAHAMNRKLQKVLINFLLFAYFLSKDQMNHPFSFS